MSSTAACDSKSSYGTLTTLDTTSSIATGFKTSCEVHMTTGATYSMVVGSMANCSMKASVSTTSSTAAGSKTSGATRAYVSPAVNMFVTGSTTQILSTAQTSRADKKHEVLNLCNFDAPNKMSNLPKSSALCVSHNACFFSNIQSTKVPVCTISVDVERSIQEHFHSMTSDQKQLVGNVATCVLSSLTSSVTAGSGNTVPSCVVSTFTPFGPTSQTVPPCNHQLVSPKTISPIEHEKNHNAHIRPLMSLSTGPTTSLQHRRQLLNRQPCSSYLRMSANPLHACDLQQTRKRPYPVVADTDMRSSSNSQFFSYSDFTELASRQYNKDTTTPHNQSSPSGTNSMALEFICQLHNIALDLVHALDKPSMSMDDAMYREQQLPHVLRQKVALLRQLTDVFNTNCLVHAVQFLDSVSYQLFDALSSVDVSDLMSSIDIQRDSMITSMMGHLIQFLAQIKTGQFL